MAPIKKILNSLVQNYDRALAALILLALLGSLLYLAVRVGAIKMEQRQFDDEITNMRPVHPTAKAIAATAFDSALKDLTDPLQLKDATWTNAMFMCAPRVWCVVCRNLIESDAEVCWYCRSPNEKGPPPTADTDGDRLPDTYEIAHGMDRLDPSDAMLDQDEDMYSTLVEWEEKTDPTNALSHPPYERELVVNNMEVVPFRLIFRSKMTLPGAPVLSLTGIKDFHMPAGTAFEVPGGTSLKLPDGSTTNLAKRTVLRYLNRLDFAMLQRQTGVGADGANAGAITEQDVPVGTFTLFDDTALSLPAGTSMVVPGKRAYKIEKEGASLKPVYGLKFGLNLAVIRRGRMSTKTFFVREGEDVNGFEVIEFIPKKDALKDVSELLLKRGDKVIRLVFNQQNRQAETIVHLRCKLPLDPPFSATLSDQERSFEFLGKKYSLLSVDIEKSNVVIQREHDSKNFELRREIIVQEAPREEEGPDPVPDSEPENNLTPAETPGTTGEPIAPWEKEESPWSKN